MELISIIVPVYNVEKYLQRCIDSILSQTYVNLEIILVDDGSTDNSGNICDEYLKKDNRIKVIHKDNGGISSARNVALDIMTGEHLCFIDSDDYVCNQYVQILYEGIKKYNQQLSMCEYLEVSESKREFFNNNVNQQFSIIDSNDALKSLYKNESTKYVVVWNKMYHKSIFETLRFPEGKINEDTYIMYKVFLLVDSIVYNDSKCYYYRKNAASIMGKGFRRERLNGIDALTEQSEYYKKNNMKELYQLAVCNRQNLLTDFYLSAKDDQLKIDIKDRLEIYFDEIKNIANYNNCFAYFSVFHPFRHKVYRAFRKIYNKNRRKY